MEEKLKNLESDLAKIRHTETKIESLHESITPQLRNNNKKEDYESRK